MASNKAKPRTTEVVVIDEVSVVPTDEEAERIANAVRDAVKVLEKGNGG